MFGAIRSGTLWGVPYEVHVGLVALWDNGYHKYVGYSVREAVQEHLRRRRGE